MKANELRLGNWVNYRSTMGTVFPIQVAVGTIEEAFERPDSGMIKPIPITEEVLLKCGFEQDLIGWRSQRNPFFVLKSLSDSGFLLGRLSIGLVKIRIAHLHQLQNLYYALTGQELIYTP